MLSFTSKLTPLLRFSPARNIHIGFRKMANIADHYDGTMPSTNYTNIATPR